MIIGTGRRNLWCRGWLQDTQAELGKRSLGAEGESAAKAIVPPTIHSRTRGMSGRVPRDQQNNLEHKDFPFGAIEPVSPWQNVEIRFLKTGNEGKSKKGEWESNRGTQKTDPPFLDTLNSGSFLCTTSTSWDKTNQSLCQSRGTPEPSGYQGPLSHIVWVIPPNFSPTVVIIKGKIINGVVLLSPLWIQVTSVSQSSKVIGPMIAPPSKLTKQTCCWFNYYQSSHPKVQFCWQAL